jgi:hypothetical protein
MSYPTGSAPLEQFSESLVLKSTVKCAWLDTTSEDIFVKFYNIN